MASVTSYSNPLQRSLQLLFITPLSDIKKRAFCSTMQRLYYHVSAEAFPRSLPAKTDGIFNRSQRIEMIHELFHLIMQGLYPKEIIEKSTFLQRLITIKEPNKDLLFFVTFALVPQQLTPLSHGNKNLTSDLFNRGPVSQWLKDLNAITFDPLICASEIQFLFDLSRDEQIRLSNMKGLLTKSYNKEFSSGKLTRSELQKVIKKIEKGRLYSGSPNPVPSHLMLTCQFFVHHNNLHKDLYKRYVVLYLKTKLRQDFPLRDESSIYFQGHLKKLHDQIVECKNKDILSGHDIEIIIAMLEDDQKPEKDLENLAAALETKLKISPTATAPSKDNAVSFFAFHLQELIRGHELDAAIYKRLIIQDLLLLLEEDLSF